MEKTNHSRASIREKICFSFGGIVYCTEMVLVLTYLMLFCSDVMQINVGIVGVVMAAVKILDAISDIVITGIADRTKTRFGKYRVWILNGIPLAAVMTLLFLRPAFLTNTTAKILWICILYIILVPVLETAVSCPYMAMIVTMSEHEKDRLDFSMARALGESVAQIIVSAVAMPIILHFGSYRNITGWRAMAAVFACIIIAASLICFFGTKERVYISNEGANGRQMGLGDKIKVLHKDRPFWNLIFIIVLFMAHFYASSALFTYFCIYCLKHTEWVSPLLTCGFVLQIITTVVLLYLGRKMEKRTLLVIGALFILAADGFLFGAAGYTQVVIYQAFLGVGNGIFNGIAFSMLPDVTDYTEWKTGIALPGMISAIATFAMKLGGAISSWLASRMLIWARYDETLQVQTVHTQRFLHFAMPLFSAGCMVAGLILVLKLKELDHSSVRRYRKAIDDRENIAEKMCIQ